MNIVEVDIEKIEKDIHEEISNNNSALNTERGTTDLKTSLDLLSHLKYKEGLLLALLIIKENMQ